MKERLSQQGLYFLHETVEKNHQSQLNNINDKSFKTELKMSTLHQTSKNLIKKQNENNNQQIEELK